MFEKIETTDCDGKRVSTYKIVGNDYYKFLKSCKYVFEHYQTRNVELRRHFRIIYGIAERNNLFIKWGGNDKILPIYNRFYVYKHCELCWIIQYNNHSH